jgi:hypothetical protein
VGSEMCIRDRDKDGLITYKEYINFIN